MDFSKMSDFEINKLVLDKVSNKKPEEWLEPYALFEPCSNPVDAWPIITSNRIGIVPGTATDKWAAHHGNWDIAIPDVNPLRAAMIVFLMMQEAK